MMRKDESDRKTTFKQIEILERFLGVLAFFASQGCKAPADSVALSARFNHFNSFILTF